MKLSNIFKKETKTVAKANVEKLDKNQLEKVIGGADNNFGEKVQSGLQQTGSATASGASLLGGALPGGSVISA